MVWNSHPVVNVDGIFYGERAESVAVIQMAAAIQSILLLSKNINRKGVLINNRSTSPLYIKFGSDSSLTDYSIRLPKNACYEVERPVYTGDIYGVWEAASGAASITEFS